MGFTLAELRNLGRKAYEQKNAGKPVEDYVSQVNKREGTETVDPSTLKSEKTLTKKERERLEEDAR